MGARSPVTKNTRPAQDTIFGPQPAEIRWTQSTGPFKKSNRLTEAGHLKKIPWIFSRLKTPQAL